MADLDYMRPGGGITSPSSNTITRPADTTAYASGDLVANSTTAGSVTPLTWTTGGAGTNVAGVRLRKSGGTLTNGSFRVHLFSASPVVANGDNGAIQPTLKANYLGSVDVTLTLTCSDGGVGVGMASVPLPLVAGGTLYGLLEARAAYTPASAETFDADLLLTRATR